MPQHNSLPNKAQSSGCAPSCPKCGRDIPESMHIFCSQECAIEARSGLEQRSERYYSGHNHSHNRTVPMESMLLPREMLSPMSLAEYFTGYDEGYASFQKQRIGGAR
jgi:hypothetical protein